LAICSSSNLDQFHSIFGQWLTAFKQHLFMQPDRLADIREGLVACSSLAYTTRKTWYFGNDETVFAWI
jgi:hypothetical protein